MLRSVNNIVIGIAAFIVLTYVFFYGIHLYSYSLEKAASELKQHTPPAEKALQ